jgi:acetylornithine deacetylase
VVSVAQLTEAEQRVLDLINATDHARVEFLRDLVRVASPEGEGWPVIKHAAAELERLGADVVDVFVPDVEELRTHPGFSPVHPEHSSTAGGEAPVMVATFRGTGGGKSLMFYGHLTAGTPAWEPALVELMTRDPWAGVIEGDKLFGRAAYNMKAGNAAAILALNAVREAGVELTGDVLFSFNTDEDVGSNGALATILRGYSADAGINPEPSGLWICPTTGGPLWFRVEVEGRSAFGGWAAGVNPIDKAIPIYHAIKGFADHRRTTVRHPLYNDLPNPAPLSVGVFRAGNWPSNTPQVAIIEGRIGMVPGESIPALRTEFEAWLQRAADQDEWLASKPPRVVWTAQWEAVETDAGHPIVTTAADVYADVIGEAPVISGKTAGNDMTKMVAYGEIPSINWGPRGGPFGHRRADDQDDVDPGFDEFVSLESYHDLTKLFALTIMRWSGA